MRMDILLGRAARQTRREAHVSLLDVAHAAGVSEATLSRFERLGRWPRRTDEIVAAYATACNLTPEYIWRLALELDEDA